MRTAWSLERSSLYAVSSRDADVAQCRPHADRPFLLGPSRPTSLCLSAHRSEGISQQTVPSFVSGHVGLFYAYVMRATHGMPDGRSASARPSRAPEIFAFARSLCRLSLLSLAMFIAAWRSKQAAPLAGSSEPDITQANRRKLLAPRRLRWTEGHYG